MPDIAEPLPDYERPPVVETVLGVQFDRLPRLKNAHLGAFWKTLDRVEWPVVEDAPLLLEWPVVADAPPLPPQFEQFDSVSGWARGVQVQLTQDPACRLQIKNGEDDRMIQVQNGRLHFNWLRKGGGSYPRFTRVRSEFAPLLERFKQFLSDENLGEFRPNQWEVTYVNHIPQGTVWRTPADWGFFEPLAAVPTIKTVAEAESFGGQWHFVIPPQLGRLHIDWEHLESRQVSKEDVKKFIRITLTARGPVGPDGVSTVLDGLDLGRATIVRSFRRLMSDDANRFWGLNHAGDS
jgi:uncharacterized protein (TIGR04255 family)